MAKRSPKHRPKRLFRVGLPTLRDVRRICDAHLQKSVDRLISAYGASTRCMTSDTRSLFLEGRDVWVCERSDLTSARWVVPLLQGMINEGDPNNAKNLGKLVIQFPGTIDFACFLGPYRYALRRRVLAVVNQRTCWVDASTTPHIDQNQEKEEEKRAQKEAQYAPKETGEVAPSGSCTSNDVHGGDNNSGEVNHPACNVKESGPPQNQPESDDTPKKEDHVGSQVVLEGLEEDSPEISSEAAPNPGSNEEDEPNKGELTSRPSQPVEPDGSDDSDQGRSDDPAASELSSPDSIHPMVIPDSSTALRQVESTEETDGTPSVPMEPSVSSRRGPGNGGFFLDLNVPKGPKKEARIVAKALDRLLAAVDTGGVEESPRMDGRRLARELSSKRYNLSRCHRQELHRGIVVAAVDCSGSCSACCNAAYAAMKALVDEGRIILLLHINGKLHRDNAALAKELPPNAPQHLDSAVFFLQKTQKVQAVINLGDWDAGNELRAICEAGIPLYWLDSYCARDKPKPASRTLRSDACSWKKHQPGGGKG